MLFDNDRLVTLGIERLLGLACSLICKLLCRYALAYEVFVYHTGAFFGQSYVFGAFASLEIRIACNGVDIVLRTFLIWSARTVRRI